jgi:uncharacterized protein DUF5753
LTREPPLELSVVLDESVLLRRIGDYAVMRAQLQHLVQMANLPNIELRVLPLSNERKLAANSFTLIGFNPTGEPGRLHDVLSTESTVKSDFYVEGETDTYLHRLLFQALVEASCSPSESRELIRQTIERVWA